MVHFSNLASWILPLCPASQSGFPFNFFVDPLAALLMPFRVAFGTTVSIFRVIASAFCDSCAGFSAGTSAGSGFTSGSPWFTSTSITRGNVEANPVVAQHQPRVSPNRFWTLRPSYVGRATWCF